MKWKTFNKKVRLIYEASEDICSFAILLALFIYLFGMIGLTFFANQIKLDAEGNVDLENGSSTRVVKFENIGYALLSAFTPQIGDNRTSYFYQYTRFSNVAYIYFPIAIFILNIVIMNIFVAIMLEKFFSDEQKKAMETEEKLDKIHEEKEKKLFEKKAHGKYKKRVKTLLMLLKTYSVVLSLVSNVKPNKIVKHVSTKTLYLFSETSLIRRFIHCTTNNWGFKIFRYLILILNSVIVSFYTPLRDPDGRTMKIIYILDIITTVFFCIEVVLNIIDKGLLLNGKNSVLRNPLMLMNFIITIIDLVSIIVDFKNNSWRPLILFLRSLRVLNLLRINKAVVLRISAIGLGLPEILQTIVIIMIFILTFGVIGVQLFKDHFHYCSMENFTEHVDIIDRYDCMNYGAEWVAYDIGFDHIGVACLTLAELFTGKSWCNIVMFISDIKEVYKQPVEDIALEDLWFPIIFMIVGFLCLKSFLTGVISNSCYYYTEKLQGLKNLTNAQRRWVSFTRVIFKARPIRTYKPTEECYILYKILMHPIFNYFILFTILLNGIVFCMEVYDPPYSLEKFCYVMHWIFIGVYILEAYLKLKFHRMNYFINIWNIYDLTILIVLIIVTIFDSADKNYYTQVFIFVIRALKICTLFSKIKILSNVFQIFVLAFPSVINLILLLFIMMYIFALFGVSLFSGIKLQTFLNDHAHFQELATAFLTIFRFSTYDGWNDIMHDVLRGRTQYFDCVSYPNYNDVFTEGGDAAGCGVPYGFVYFLLFIIIVPFMFLYIFIAIGIDNVMEIDNLSKSVLSDE